MVRRGRKPLSQAEEQDQPRERPVGLRQRGGGRIPEQAGQHGGVAVHDRYGTGAYRPVGQQDPLDFPGRGADSDHAAAGVKTNPVLPAQVAQPFDDRVEPPLDVPGAESMFEIGDHHQGGGDPPRGGADIGREPFVDLAQAGTLEGTVHGLAIAAPPAPERQMAQGRERLPIRRFGGRPAEESMPRQFEQPRPQVHQFQEADVPSRFGPPQGLEPPREGGLHLEGGAVGETITCQRIHRLQPEVVVHPFAGGGEQVREHVGQGDEGRTGVEPEAVALPAVHLPPERRAVLENAHPPAAHRQPQRRCHPPEARPDDARLPISPVHALLPSPAPAPVR